MARIFTPTLTLPRGRGGWGVTDFRDLVLVAFAFVAMLTACAPVPGAPTTGSDAGPRSIVPKRITGAIVSLDPGIVRSSANGAFGGGTSAGVDVIEDLVHAGATRRDDVDVLRPVLAEALPSVENGLWKVLPDGHMETTWTLKNGALWQDGTAFTTQDLMFTLTVCMDEETSGLCVNPGFNYLDTAKALDDRTITVSWKQTFIDADALFTTQFAMPIPRHLLERTYQENKRGLPDLPYWNHEFIGAGPFQVRDWVDGSHITLVASDRYILGRPKIDEIAVKFIPDPNTVVTNMLAGEVDVNLGRGMSLEQALEIRDQWREGQLEVGLPGNWVEAYPQFIDPKPAVLLDPRFRKGLMHAIDRQEMADTLQGGFAPVAHAFFDTDLPQYRELDPFVVKYEFDPRKAVQFIESTGYVRSPDGSFRDASGQRLSIEIRTTGTQEIQNKSMFAVADYWQRIGIGVETVIEGPQRRNDFEYRATRPAFELAQIPDGNKGLRRAYSSVTPLPENNFVKTSNLSRYMNPEFDAMLDRYFSTIPLRERTQALGQILQHTTDLVRDVGLFRGTEPTMVSSRVLNVSPRKTQEGTMAWNAHQWDLRN